MFAVRSSSLRSLQAVQRLSLRSRLSTIPAVRPARRTGSVSVEDRAALRAARKERASRVLAEAQEGGAAAAAATKNTAGGSGRSNVIMSRYVWYLSVGVPSAILIWGFSDENSPPAKFSRMIGLTDLISQYTEDIARPSHTKLLPDWSQVRFFALVCFIGIARRLSHA